IRRPRFLLAFKNHLHVHADRNLLRPQRIDRRQNRHDRRLVVRRRPRINPPVILISASSASIREGNPLPASLNRVVAQRRFERFPTRPPPRVPPLPVIVRVKNPRPFPPRPHQFSKHHRPTPHNRQQLCLDPARFHHFPKPRRVLLNICLVARHIRNRQKPR